MAYWRLAWWKNSLKAELDRKKKFPVNENQKWNNSNNNNSKHSKNNLETVRLTVRCPLSIFVSARMSNFLKQILINLQSGVNAMPFINVCKCKNEQLPQTNIDKSAIRGKWANSTSYQKIETKDYSASR